MGRKKAIIDKYKEKEGIILDNTIRSLDYLRGSQEIKLGDRKK